MAPEEEPKTGTEQTERRGSSSAPRRNRRSGRGRRGRGRRPQAQAQARQAEPGHAQEIADPELRAAQAYQPDMPEPEPHEVFEALESPATVEPLATAETERDDAPEALADREPEELAPESVEAEPELTSSFEEGEPTEAAPPLPEKTAKTLTPRSESVEVQKEIFAPPQAPPPRLPPRQPASPATIQKAIDEVNQVIEQLKHALDEMEEVLETLELAERQKDADEREIESLRRALRQVHRPRESGGHGQSHHHHQRGPS